MQQQTPLAVALAWQEAASSKDFARLYELCDPNVAVAGPRGFGHGPELLQEWLLRSGLTFRTLRLFARGNDVVVEQHGVWHSPETGKPTSEADFASHFRVEGGRIVHLTRYESFDMALERAGLGFEDEVFADSKGSSEA